MDAIAAIKPIDERGDGSMSGADTGDAFAIGVADASGVGPFTMGVGHDSGDGIGMGDGKGGMKLRVGMGLIWKDPAESINKTDVTKRPPNITRTTYLSLDFGIAVRFNKRCRLDRVGLLRLPILFRRYSLTAFA
jgi:hypothetical protein